MNSERSWMVLREAKVLNDSGRFSKSTSLEDNILQLSKAGRSSRKETQSRKLFHVFCAMKVSKASSTVVTLVVSLLNEVDPKKVKLLVWGHQEKNISSIDVNLGL